MKLFQEPSLRMEMIDFQLKDAFSQKLVDVIEKIQSYTKRGYIGLEIQKVPELKTLEALIEQRFNMRVNICTTGGLAAIIPFYFSENHVFLRKYLRGVSLLESQSDTRSEGAKGVVDMEKATLSGVFSEYVFSVYMNFSQLFSGYNLTTRQVAGVLMHELGHGFYSCAYSAHLSTGNQIFRDAVKKAGESKDEKRVEVLYKELKPSMPGLTKEVAEGLCNTNPMVFGKAAMTAVGESVTQQLGDVVYDRTSFEQMADNFATRFGFGDDLVQSLKVLHGGDAIFYSQYFEAISRAAEVMFILGSTMRSMVSVGWMMTAMQVIAPVFKIFGLIFVLERILSTAFMIRYYISMAGESGKDYTYDDLRVRFNRIRQQMIEAIKRKDLTKKDAERILADLEVQREIIDSMSTFRGPIDWFFNTFNPKDRRAKTSIERQQAVEGLLNNELFVKALSIKTKA